MPQTGHQLLLEAWRVRESAFVIGPTKVGCAVLSDSGRVHTGCNEEHRYRSHDVYAEVNAITSMISSGDQNIAAVAIAAERDRFTPCGAWLDWIFQFSDPDTTVVVCQSKPDGPIAQYILRDLMPYFPR